MITLHRYGLLPSRFDPRTAVWKPPPALKAQALPPSVDLSGKFGPVEDQQALGSCGPNALAGILQFDEMGEQTSDQALPSRLFLYYVTRTLMGTVNSDSGVDNITMAKAVAAFGFCPESQWPYDIRKFTQQPGKECFTSAAGHKVTDYASVPQTQNDLCALLASGKPFVLPFTVYESFESQQTAQTGNAPLPRPRERILGGHDVVAVGYDLTKTALPYEFIRIRNSWGTGWGKNGYGTLPLAFCLNPHYAGDPGGVGGWSFGSVPGDPAPVPVPVPTPPGPVPPQPPPAPVPGRQTVTLAASDLTPQALARLQALLGQGGSFTVSA